jgi:hypothetical protein
MMTIPFLPLNALVDAWPWPWRKKGQSATDSPSTAANSDTLDTTPGGESPARWVKVAENLQPVVAAIVKGRLESVDIPAVIRQESIGSVMGLTVGPLGWSTVWVPEEKAEAAVALLAQTFDDEDADDMTPTDKDPQ